MESKFFNIGTNKKLKISSFMPIGLLGVRYGVRVDLFIGKKKIPLYDSDIESFLSTACSLFQKALSNQLFMPEFINVDIGYAYNEYLNLPSKIWLKTSWKGSALEWCFFAGRKFRTTTHLYNDAEGNIVLHVSRNCHWRMDHEEIRKSGVSFKRFIKDYKPLVVTIIEPHIARDLITEFEPLLAKAWENQSRYDTEHKQAIKEKRQCKYCLMENKYLEKFKKSNSKS